MTAHNPIAAGENNAVALTEADGTHHEGPELLGLGAEGWVYVGITIFLILAIVVAKAPRRIAEILDARIADTRRELDEARRLREEAEALLASAKARNDASAGDAAAIVSHAEAEAGALIAKAEQDADELMRRRAKMAEDKIGSAERQAVADVRAKAAEAAAQAAGEIIARRHDAGADRTLVDRTIAGLGRPN